MIIDLKDEEIKKGAAPGYLEELAGRLLRERIHILAADTDIDAEQYQRMRGKSYQEVLRTNGQISFPEVLRQQKRL